jgi:tetratricopeptide (TPR) repeat protein
MLAGQYLQRYREAPDVGDLLRAVAVARQAMKYQPRYNVSAEATLASAYVALHKFRLAKRFADDVVALTPWDSDAIAAAASLDMELGNYSRARHLLSKTPGSRAGATWSTVAAHYAELTGSVSAARALIARAMVEADANSSLPAEGRAWYHWRAGELAFAAGDLGGAESDYREALAIFPNYWHATNGLAKVYWAQSRWHEALDFATKSADVFPLPETLGYQADAQRELGDRAGATATQDLIGAIERIGNAQGINDRLIAVYYSDHSINLNRAVAIARRDAANRDDLFAEDTLAWALARSGRWVEARAHAERATALGTQDARLQYHAGVIALHNGDRSEAAKRLSLALEINPHFHPYFEQDARRLLSKLHALGDRNQTMQGRTAWLTPQSYTRTALDPSLTTQRQTLSKSAGTTQPAR